MSDASTANVTVLSQTNPIFQFQRVERNEHVFALADAESAHVFPRAKCSGVYEWLVDKDYNRLALSRDVHVNFDVSTGHRRRGRDKRRCKISTRRHQVLAFRPLRPCHGYNIVQLPLNNSAGQQRDYYEIPLEIVLNDEKKAKAVLSRLGKRVEMKSSSGDRLFTLFGPDLQIYYPTESWVPIIMEDVQCDDDRPKTTKQVFVNKVPGVDDLGTCWSVLRSDDDTGQSALEAAEVLEKCLLWNYNDAMERWSSSPSLK